VKLLVEALYRLGAENGKQANWDKVEHLLEHLNFLYKVQ
jgi:hypothetical protein